MKTKNGFTVLEIIVSIIVVGIAVVLFFIQMNTVEAMERDDHRKIAINAMYYAIEEGFYKDNEYYPETIDSAEVLPWIDPNLFTDPFGVNIWTEGSNYVYEAHDCTDGKCKQYSLRADLEKEDDYVRTNRH